MGFKLGNTSIGSLYLGSTKIVEAYLGSVKVMSSRPIVYNVTCSGSHGTVTASPSSGIPGTVVTLSNSPDTGYAFNSYTVNGSTLTGNTFVIGNSDVNVTGNFTGIVRNVTCTASNGTVTASPNSGIIGTTVTLSNTPDTGYEFDSYSLTGATLYDTNKFDINNSDVNVVGNFIASGPSFDEVTIGTQTWMAKNLSIDDGQGGISTRTVNYGQGDVVEYYYTWPAAVRVANSINGWHLPTDTEWTTLATAVGGSFTAGTSLKSTYGWSSGNGDGSYSFAAFPAGYYSGSSYNSLGSQARFWTSTEKSSASAYIRQFKTGSQMSSNYFTKTGYAYSVRLIKDS